MTRIALNIDALGAGAYDGEGAMLRYGGERAAMRWHENQGMWIGEETPLVTLSEIDPMIDANSLPDIYDYFKVGISGNVGAWGWQPHPILGANQGYTAGMVLQVRFDADWWSFNASRSYKLGLILYPFDSSTLIGPEIDPADYIALELDSLPGQRRMQTTGWVTAATGNPGQAVIAPHLYTKFISGPDSSQHARLEYLRCMWRWIGTPS